ncbi:MAG: aldo/keto reductase [Clostridia bacterium]|nr:aldo/keto reductase [Clostridia bacterium]
MEFNDLREVFVSAVRNGFTMYDTAPIYSSGESERIIGELKQYYDGKVEIEENSKKEIQISTKFFPTLFKPTSKMAEECEMSLERMHLDNIDIFWIHVPQNYKKWTKELIPLLKERKVKHVGVSNFNLNQIIEAKEILEDAGYKLSGVQNHLSLIYQNNIDNNILDWCHENGVKFFSYMVMEQGALSGKYTPESPMPRGSMRAKVYTPAVLRKMKPLQDYLNELAEQYGVSPSQIAVAWALEKGTIPIAGVTQQKQVYELTKTFDVHLTPQEVAKLTNIGKEVNIKAKGF